MIGSSLLVTRYATYVGSDRVRRDEDQIDRALLFDLGLHRLGDRSEIFLIAVKVDARMSLEPLRELHAHLFVLVDEDRLDLASILQHAQQRLDRVLEDLFRPGERDRGRQADREKAFDQPRPQLGEVIGQRHPGVV
jgi:hypothetical protein